MPTNRTVIGPILQQRGSLLIVNYDCEQDDGVVAWSKVLFDEILVLDYRQSTCCSGEDVIGWNEIKCLKESPFLAEMLSKWQEAVGWQDFHKNKGGPGRFKHFKMFFDDVACINVIAASCTVESMQDFSTICRENF
jgi:hypothetical protein